MDFYPLFLDLNKEKCLVVGGGKIALQKTRGLYQAGAIIDVIAPEIIDDFKTLDTEQRITLYHKPYTNIDLSVYRLVVCATNQRQLNERVFHDANKKNTLINVVDQPDLCNVIVPSTINRSPLIIAISSNGKAAMLSARIRDHIITSIPTTYQTLIIVLEKIKAKLSSTAWTFQRKQALWTYLLDEQINQLLAHNNQGSMHQCALDLLEQFENKKHTFGHLSIVGAGPGDPELLTLKGFRLIARADIILYDWLVNEDILDFARKGVSLVYVGKKGYGKRTSQARIHEMMKEYYQQGKNIVRLKGGDPFIFGRGGEEVQFLVDHCIPFQVVPGISAANGCAAYHNIPLTHRDHAHSVEFLTLHGDGSGNIINEIPWSHLVQPFKTLVFFMGKANLKNCITHLLEHKLDPNTPLAIISKGTTNQDRIFKSLLKDAGKFAEDPEVTRPTLIIIGHVVNCIRPPKHVE